MMRPTNDRIGVRGRPASLREVNGRFQQDRPFIPYEGRGMIGREQPSLSELDMS